MSEHALLLMGGIGDLLHYLTRLTAFLKEGHFGPRGPHVCGEVHEVVTRTHRAVYAGTPNERMQGCEPETLPGVPAALALSYHADLFVSTDTGLATFRELTGRKNIYCVSRFWVEEVRGRYGYFDGETRRRTRSAFAFGREDLLDLLAAELRLGGATRAAEGVS